MREADTSEWAGIASLRVRASGVLPGFARLKATAGAWSGEFLAGGAITSLASGTAIELLLPRDSVVRATVHPSGEPGIFTLEGESPWPAWSVQPALSGPSHIARSGILEVRAPSAITRANWLRSEDLPLTAGIRVLLDYRPLQEIHVPLEWFFAAGSELRDLNAKVAAVLGGQLALGLMRAAREHGVTARPEEFCAFSDYDEARLWLMR